MKRTREREAKREQFEGRRSGRRRPRETDSSIVYGVVSVLELLRAESRKVNKVIIAEGAHESRIADILELARQKGVAVHRVPREKLGQYVEQNANHQGILAFTAAVEYEDAEEILNNVVADPLLLILDSVEDPRNFGAILRTAECAGINGVFIPERRAVGLTETVAKSSAGATEYVKVAKVPNLNRLIEDLKKRNVWVVGTSIDATMDYTHWNWNQPTALILGGEGTGLHRLVAENCDVLVKIPMYGKIESLNVSVAAGVILFEARRQRELSQTATEN
ncbi:MAG TPA: 23S rRNA (guanosine(2251)-2'-O)-methyltransferase RlmB [Pyrinomonadaceae bacterium]|nr:23S rRNA (guanosine(2251)-2'-O)-methyltransferase RlmB [Pyrinomonadaceae bacterium]